MGLDDDDPGKAYTSDEYAYGDCWQLVDFMKKLGFSYPISAEGRASGATYYFDVKQER